MSAGEAHHAGTLFAEVLAPHYPDLDSAELRQLGAEVFARTQQRVRAAGLDPVLAWDAYQTFLMNIINHLRRHGGGSVLRLRAFAHACAKNAAWHLMKGLKESQVVSLEELLLEGDVEYSLPGPPPVCQHDDDLQRMLLIAVGRLRGRQRQFAELYFVRQRPAAEVKAAMSLPSNRSCARLLRQTTRAMVEIVRDLLATAGSWVA